MVLHLGRDGVGLGFNLGFPGAGGRFDIDFFLVFVLSTLKKKKKLATLIECKCLCLATCSLLGKSLSGTRDVFGKSSGKYTKFPIVKNQSKIGTNTHEYTDDDVSSTLEETSGISIPRGQVQEKIESWITFSI